MCGAVITQDGSEKGSGPSILTGNHSSVKPVAPKSNSDEIVDSNRKGTTRKFDHLGSSSLHKAMCKKRVTHGIQKIQKLKIRHKFASPTDRLLSPCSQKLNQHKAKLFVAKSNPTKLNFARNKNASVSDEDDGEEGY